jgi:hypothetical protein
MMIEVVHVNGTYIPDQERHATPSQASGVYYRRLAGVLRTAQCWDVKIIYRQNCGDAPDDFWTDPAALRRMKETDPLLAELGDGNITAVADGFLPLDQAKRLNALEDDTIKREGTAVVLGAYTNACVSAAATYIISRNPLHQVRIDPSLSIDNGCPPVGPPVLTTSLETKFPLPVRSRIVYEGASPWVLEYSQPSF